MTIDDGPSHLCIVFGWWRLLRLSSITVSGTGKLVLLLFSLWIQGRSEGLLGLESEGKGVFDVLFVLIWGVGFGGFLGMFGRFGNNRKF